jgi:site-specific DNA-methyltransferase (adenine-specific)
MSDHKMMWPIEKLKNWDKNPRTISDQQLERLKKQIQKLGQYKPLVITPDGTVLGGNMRLKAFQELGIQEIWVSIVEPKDLNEMLEFNLSDNDRAGKYDEELLHELMPEFDLNWSEWSVDTLEPTPMTDLFASPSSTLNDKSSEIDVETMKGELNATCPKCGFQFTHNST